MTATAALAARAGAITARNLTVQHNTGRDGAWVRGRQPLLARMVDNVLDNAIGHNRDGGWIRVDTSADPAADPTAGAASGAGLARLVVENGGAVLDQTEVAGLAQPFRRLGADRTGSGHGPGWACPSSRPSPRPTAARWTCTPGPGAACGSASRCRWPRTRPPPPSRGC
jgi:signal transduction histidine kinase